MGFPSCHGAGRYYAIAIVTIVTCSTNGDGINEAKCSSLVTFQETMGPYCNHGKCYTLHNRNSPFSGAFDWCPRAVNPTAKLVAITTKEELDFLRCVLLTISVHADVYTGAYSNATEKVVFWNSTTQVNETLLPADKNLVVDKKSPLPAVLNFSSNFSRLYLVSPDNNFPAVCEHDIYDKAQCLTKCILEDVDDTDTANDEPPTEISTDVTADVVPHETSTYGMEDKLHQFCSRQKCYTLNEESMNFYYARDRCENQLTSIMTKQELEFIRCHLLRLQFNDDVLINGLRRWAGDDITWLTAPPATVNATWLPLSDTTSYTDTPMQFTVLNASTNFSTLGLVLMNDFSPFICEKKNIALPVQENPCVMKSEEDHVFTSTDVANPTPPIYVKDKLLHFCSRQKCYTLNEERTNFYYARIQCENELTSIMTKKELDFIRCHLLRIPFNDDVLINGVRRWAGDDITWFIVPPATVNDTWLPLGDTTSYADRSMQFTVLNASTNFSALGLVSMNVLSPFICQKNNTSPPVPEYPCVLKSEDDDVFISTNAANPTPPVFVEENLYPFCSPERCYTLNTNKLLYSDASNWCRGQPTNTDCGLAVMETKEELDFIRCILLANFLEYGVMFDVGPSLSNQGTKEGVVFNASSYFSRPPTGGEHGSSHPFLCEMENVRKMKTKTHCCLRQPEDGLQTISTPTTTLEFETSSMVVLHTTTTMDLDAELTDDGLSTVTTDASWNDDDVTTHTIPYINTTKTSKDDDLSTAITGVASSEQASTTANELEMTDATILHTAVANATDIELTDDSTPTFITDVSSQRPSTMLDEPEITAATIPHTTAAASELTDQSLYTGSTDASSTDNHFTTFPELQMTQTTLPYTTPTTDTYTEGTDRNVQSASTDTSTPSETSGALQTNTAKGFCQPAEGGNDCLSHTWINKVESMLSTPSSCLDASEYLANETARDSFDVYDLTSLNLALNAMQEKAREKTWPDMDSLSNYSENVFTVVDNVLQDRHERMWEKLPKSKMAELVHGFNDMMEDTGFMLASQLNGTRKYFEKRSFCIIVASDGNSCSERGHFHISNWTDEDNHTWSANVTLPKSWGIGCSINQQRTMVGTLHAHLHRYLQNSVESGKVKSKMVKSAVFGVSVHNTTYTTKFEADEEVFITLHLLDGVDPGSHLECGFWNYDRVTNEGFWDTEGCRLAWKGLTHVTCVCSHLTNFAVLMDMDGETPDDYLLKCISIVCGSLSIVCELVTFVVLHSFRSLKTTRTSITKNLCLCLALGTTVMMIGLQRTEDKVGCSIIAGLIHYFFLCAFSWMAMEGYHLYLLLVRVFQSKETHAGRRYVIGYGIPLVIVGITAGVCHDGYGTETYCWLDSKNHCVWFFLAPVAFVILANLVFLIVSLRSAASVKKMGRDPKKTEKLRKWMRGAFSLTTLLGITWIVGYMDFITATTVFKYIFSFLSASQGIFIFFFHCLTNENVRQTISRAIARTAQSRFYSSSRRPTNATTLYSNSSSRRCRSRSESQDSSVGSGLTPNARPMPSSVLKGITLSLKHLPSQFDVLWKEQQ